MMGASTALSAEAQAEIKTLLGEQGSLISFNGTEYDLPLLAAALGGASVGRMYRESQGSVGKLMTRAVLKRRHIDLQRLIPTTIEGWRGGEDEAFAQRSGLRQAGMRLHLRDIRGVEWNADSGIAEDSVRRRMVDDRCTNDLALLAGLMDGCRHQVAVRDTFGEMGEGGSRRGRDPMALFDSQLGEWLLAQRMGARWGDGVRRRPGKESNHGGNRASMR